MTCLTLPLWWLGMDLDYFIQALDVQVVRVPPPGGWWGAWDHRTRTIYLHPDLSPVQERYTLSHELAHAYHGHTGYRQEWEWWADVEAAKHLVPICQWMRATAVHESIEAVAHELEVHPHVARVFQDYWGHCPHNS